MARSLAFIRKIAGDGNECDAGVRQDHRGEPLRIDRIGTDDACRADRARPVKQRLQKNVGKTELVIERAHPPERRGSIGEQHRAAAGIGREEAPLFVFRVRTVNGFFRDCFGALSDMRLCVLFYDARNAAGGDEHCRVQHVIRARIFAAVRGKEPFHFLCLLRRDRTVKRAEIEIFSRSARNGGLLHMRRCGVHIPELFL